jgi:pimeloyl-ACP methyl ester carboxylesterase
VARAANGIRSAAADAAAAIAAGDPAAAGERFIDYWMGVGTWRGMPDARRTSVAGSMSNVAGWTRALLFEPTPLQAFRGLDVPVLYLVGMQSPAASRGVARLLMGVLPKVSVTELAGLGHMGPVTHPEIVNEAIAGFLSRH